MAPVAPNPAHVGRGPLAPEVHDPEGGPAAAAAEVGRDRAFLMLPPGTSGTEARLFGHHLEPGCVNALASFAPSGVPRPTRIKDPEHARAMRRLAAAGVQVWTPDRVERLTRVKISDMSRFYPELVLRWSMPLFGSVALWRPEGPVLLSFLASKPEPPRFGDTELEVLSLLVSALNAGAAAARLLKEARPGIDRLLDEIELAVSLHFPDGTEYRNRRLPGLLETLDHPERLMAESSHLAARILRLSERPTKSTPRPPPDSGTRTVHLDGDLLYLNGSWLPPGAAGPGPAALVSVRGARARLPDAPSLADRYDLTSRQAQVARMLAEGASSQDIADRLGISPHTARHHAQRVVERVGTHSRKALGLRFLQDLSDGN